MTDRLVAFSCSIFETDVVLWVPGAMLVFVDLSVASIEEPVGVVVKSAVSSAASEAIVSGFVEAPVVSMVGTGTGFHCAAHRSGVVLDYTDLHRCGDMIDRVQDPGIIVQALTLGPSILYSSVLFVYSDSHVHHLGQGFQ